MTSLALIRLLPRALALLLACCLSGCLDYVETLTIRPDGSGTLEVSFTVDTKPAKQLFLLGDPEGDVSEMEVFAKEDLEHDLGVEGIELKKLERKPEGDKVRVNAVLAFKDLKALKEVSSIGKDRQVEFFDEGDGKTGRVVYTIDASDGLAPTPLPEGEELAALDAEEQAQVAQAREILTKARAGLRTRAKVVLPGPLKRSNGMPDRTNPNASLWAIDKKTQPKRHAALGKGKVILMLLIEKQHLPFVKEWKPLPPPTPPGGQEPTSKPATPPR